MSQPTRWTLDTSQLLAHIFYAVGNTDRVLVTCAHGDFQGTLAYPDAEEVLIEMHRALPELPPGAPLCISYDGPSDTYRFYTEVSEVNGRQIRAALPYALEHSDRRSLDRLAVAPGDDFAVRLDGPEPRASFPLLDISTGGVCFVLRRDAGLRTGELVRGELLLPGEAGIPVTLEVRQLQLRRGKLNVGTRFHSISLRNRAQLAGFLVQWKSRAAA